MNIMPFDPYELSFLGLTIFAFLYGFFGFKQPSIFEEIVDKPHAIKIPENNQSKKYMKSGLKAKDVERFQKQIMEYMEKEKPYLDRELSIGDVAYSLNIPRHFITEIINNHMGKNFYYLINEFRVNEVKKRLVDPKYQHLTILAIAFDSGFNSKSTFNSIFKDLTGITPSHYLKEHSRKELP
jgi:AraC-like DNA-binding protein